MYYSITSPQNQQVKRWKKLLTKKGRQIHASYLVEGVHLLLEAQKAKSEIKALIVKEGFADTEGILTADRDHTPVYQLTSSIFSQLCETEHPQGIMAEVSIPYWEMEILMNKSKLLLLLDEIQDPGNLGTILRTASAAGVDSVVLGKGTVDPYNSKAVRSTMGALFHLPVIEADLLELIPVLKEKNIAIVGTSPHHGVHAFDYLFPNKVAIVLGNESKGIQQMILQKMDKALMVPMPGAAESYNVSITAGMLLYEHMRQHLRHKN